MDNKENPIRVLIVDDDDISREVLALLLEKEGYLVETVVSGEAALSHLPQTAAPPQVLLIDMQMPGISGTKLANQLRRMVHNSATLLLAMSASQPADPELNGFDGFLLKPFTMQTLNAAIHGKVDLQHEQTSTQNSSILNEAVYAKLAASMKPSQLDQLYAMCLTDAEKRIAAMRDAARNHDAPTYKKEAHAIKGSAGMVGAVELQTLATSMESTGPDANHVATLDEFIAACERLRRILVAHVRE